MLEVKLVDTESQTGHWWQGHHQNVAATEASYLVALGIARAAKSHTNPKDLLPPATKDSALVMMGGGQISYAVECNFLI